MAVLISFGLLYPSVADILTTIIILSVFVNEYISPALVVRQFGDVLRLEKEKPRPGDGLDGDTP